MSCAVLLTEACESLRHYGARDIRYGYSHRRWWASARVDGVRRRVTGAAGFARAMADLAWLLADMRRAVAL